MPLPSLEGNMSMPNLAPVPVIIPLPVPSPERQAALSAFAGVLFERYGPDRATWPHPDRWPWWLLQSPRAA